jgi:hypothetical protein
VLPPTLDVPAMLDVPPALVPATVELVPPAPPSSSRSAGLLVAVAEQPSASQNRVTAAALVDIGHVMRASPVSITV